MRQLADKHRSSSSKHVLRQFETEVDLRSVVKLQSTQFKWSEGDFQGANYK